MQQQAATELDTSRERGLGTAPDRPRDTPDVAAPTLPTRHPTSEQQLPGSTSLNLAAARAALSTPLASFQARRSGSGGAPVWARLAVCVGANNASLPSCAAPLLLLISICMISCRVMNLRRRHLYEFPLTSIGR